MLATPLLTGGGQRLQALQLLADRIVRCKAVGAAMFQQIRDLIVDQAALGTDGGGKEAEIVGDGAIVADLHLAAQRLARFAFLQ